MIGNINYLKENIQEILKKKEVYNDKFFKPTIQSLIPDDEEDHSFAKTPKNYLEEYLSYKWIRPKQIYKNMDFNIFIRNIYQNEISQGSLGNCYFLVALIGIAKCPVRIYNLFITQKINNIGAYAVKLLLQGQVKLVTVDDYIPCKADNTLAFSSTKQCELWLSIIEKAWAKLNGCCYMRTWLGIPSEALGALSEAPTIYENHKKYIGKGTIYEIWEKLLSGFRKKWVICANTEDVINADEIGLVENHAYSILDCYECDTDILDDCESYLNEFKKKCKYFREDKLRLIKIRNPWGCKEWKGDFCNSSKLWNKELKEKVKYEDSLSEGIFYMTFEDFVDYFPWTFFCKIEDNYHYRYGKIYQSKEVISVNYKEIKSDKLNDPSKLNEVQTILIEKDKQIDLYPFCCLFLNVQTKTHCYLTLHQLQKRFINKYFMRFNKNSSNLYSNYKTPIAQIILTKWDGTINKYEFIKGEFINWEKLILDVILEPGEYHIFCRVYWKYSNINCKIVLSTYADHPLDIYELNYNNDTVAYYNLYQDRSFPNPSNWLMQILKQIGMRSKKKEYFCEREKTSYFSYDIFESSTGYGVLYYENNSEEGIINSLIQFQNMNGIRLLNHTSDKDGLYSFKVEPKTQLILVFEILDLPWETMISWSHFKWFEYTTEYIIRNFLNDKKYTENTEFENGEINFYKITHEGGILIYIENKGMNEYKCHLTFTDIVNLEVRDSMYINNKMKLQLKKRSFYYFEIKSIKRNLSYKLSIQKRFKKI